MEHCADESFVVEAVLVDNYMQASKQGGSGAEHYEDRWVEVPSGDANSASEAGLASAQSPQNGGSCTQCGSSWAGRPSAAGCCERVGCEAPSTTTADARHVQAPAGDACATGIQHV